MNFTNVLDSEFTATKSLVCLTEVEMIQFLQSENPDPNINDHLNSCNECLYTAMKLTSIDHQKLISEYGEVKG